MGWVRGESLEWTVQSRGERFGYRRRQLGAAAGWRMLGCSLFEIPPGRRPFPYHWHAANEEAIYVLDGTGTLRLADEECAVGPGDYVALPVGEQGAHQLINTSDGLLRFLVVSQMIEPEVVVQPDSGKLGMITGAPPGRGRGRRDRCVFFRQDDAIELDLDEA